MAEKQKSRKEIEDKFKWNLNDLYSNEEDWQKDYDQIKNNLHNFDEYKDNLHKKEILLKCLGDYSKFSEMGGRVYVYPNLKLHEDTTNHKYQGMCDRCESLLSTFAAHTSFIASELALLEEDILLNFVETEEFQVYKQYIKDLLRRKEHILSKEVEEVLAKTLDIASSPDTIFSMINDADMEFGEVKDEDGKEIELTHGKYASLLESTNQEVRKQAFNTYYDAYIKQKNTILATYNLSVKMDVFYAHIRNYKSAINEALFNDNIDDNVYTNLIDTITKNIHLMHSYVEKRKKALKLEEIHMYDLYVPMVEEINSKVTYDEACETVLEALKPLGEEYLNKVKELFENNWIDVYENKGKQSGAYSWGAYGSHPYILMNFDNKVNDMFTLIHEIGHAMHSNYSWETQDYINANYTIFVAEVASTVNEALLMQHLLKTTEDKNQKKYLINYFLDQFKGTVFRQTMFAEFELVTHDMVEKGEPLTVEALNQIYRDLNKKYYGDGIVIDEKSDIEWARIPHFYSSFYVYQYATGFCAAINLSEKILNGTSQDIENYINFLKSGSSDYSIELLKKAGVDMSSHKPIEEALKVFEELLNEF